MSATFMTESEAEALINEHMDELMSKLFCATQCSESGASTGLTGDCGALTCIDGLCCGCCAR